MAIPGINLPKPISRTRVKRLSCKEVSEIISRQHEQPLTTGEKLWLKLHLYICNRCRNCRSNTRLMRAALKRYLEQGHDK